MDQWRERLSVFLGIDPKEIGQISGSKKHITGKLDVAVIQSLCRKGVVDDIVAEYGHVIVDECHHVAALSFEQLMKKVKAHYVLGLSATPVRKDGHHPIIIMQCGPIRYRYSGKKATADSAFNHVVHVRSTCFQNTSKDGQPALYEIYQQLIVDETRNELILPDKINDTNSSTGSKQFVEQAAKQNWIAYSKKPFPGPEQVLEYLGRYTHRVAICNNRVKSKPLLMAKSPSPIGIGGMQIRKR